MVRIFITILRKAWPPLLGLIGATLKLLGVTLTIMWKGSWEGVKNLAQYWTFQAVKAGVPPNQGAFLEYFFRLVALLTVLMGWIVLSHLTVLMFHWLVVRW